LVNFNFKVNLTFNRTFNFPWDFPVIPSFNSPWWLIGLTRGGVTRGETQGIGPIIGEGPGNWRKFWIKEVLNFLATSFLNFSKGLKNPFYSKSLIPKGHKLKEFQGVKLKILLPSYFYTFEKGTIAFSSLFYGVMPIGPIWKLLHGVYHSPFLPGGSKFPFGGQSGLFWGPF